MQVIILIPTSYFLYWWTLDLLRIDLSSADLSTSHLKESAHI